MKTNIFVIGFPKTGTIWLARLLGDVMNCPVSTLGGGNGYPTEGQNRQSNYVIRHGHARPERLMEKFFSFGDKIVYTTRDPRDVAVSAMFYWKDSCIQESIARITNPHNAI